MNKIISALNKAITKAGGAVNNAILENSLKSLGWHVCPPMVWRSIESAPYDEPVLISWINHKGNRVVGHAWQNIEDVESYSETAENFKTTRATRVWSFDYDGQEVLRFFPTHWMPLPAAPEDPK